jgi:hypothetical protein
MPERQIPQPDASPYRLAQRSDLRNALSAWIAQNPEAEFDLVARTANRLLRRHGFPLVLDASGLLKPGQTELRIRAGSKTFLFEAGQELSLSPDICGERFLRIPGRILGTERAALISDGREYPFSLKGFKRERFRVLRGKKLVSVLYSPEPVEPIGLSTSGRAVYIRFSLNEGETAEWWHRIARHQPSLLGEDPYLALRVERSRLYFIENLDHLPSQDFVVEETDPSIFRWRFQPSGLVLELSSRCG